MKQLSDEERFENIKTLYCLYRAATRVPDEVLQASGVTLEEVLSMLDALEEVTFPPCFEIDPKKIMAIAARAVAMASPQGSA